MLFMELSRSVTCAGCFQRSEMWLFKINVQLLKQKGKKSPCSIGRCIAGALTLTFPVSPSTSPYHTELNAVVVI